MGVVVIVAPVLHDLAGTLTGQEPSDWTQDAMRWAYAVREAVSMVKPTWVVSHFDLEFEARAITDIASEPDGVWDVEVTADGPFAPGIELVRTLASIDPSWTVAASVTGPVRTARALAERWRVEVEDLDELSEACGDVSAALMAAYAEAGAREIVVWEGECGDDPAAHRALTRRAALAGVPLTLVGSSRLEGYGRTVGAGVVSVPAGAAAVSGAWGAALLGAAPDSVVITDGPVPGNAPPEALLTLAAAAR
jgi:hypothetical protein